MFRFVFLMLLFIIAPLNKGVAANHAHKSISFEIQNLQTPHLQSIDHTVHNTNDSACVATSESSDLDSESNSNDLSNDLKYTVLVAHFYYNFSTQKKKTKIVTKAKILITFDRYALFEQLKIPFIALV